MNLQEQLEKFLLDRGLGDKEPGYGHATCKEIADELIKAGWVELAPPRTTDCTAKEGKSND